MMMTKNITADKALQRLMAQCARREMCERQAEEKLRLWAIPEKECAAIMERLVKERYIDNDRYARAYAREKLLFSGWGEKKVEMMLRSKGINHETIAQAIEENTDKEDMQEKLRSILEQKRRQLRNESDEYKKKQKLIRFALSRGFSYEDVIANL